MRCPRRVRASVAGGHDVSALYFETDTADGFREPGLSKERRLEPQIIIGLLTDATGFPLAVEAFEGDKAETATMLPVINAFKTAHQLTEVTVVADAGMRVVVHPRDPHPVGAHVVTRWRRQHPSQDVPDGHVFTHTLLLGFGCFHTLPSGRWPPYIAGASHAAAPGVTLLMFGFRRRGVAPMHAGMTLDEVRQCFTGAGWEQVDAERTSAEEMVERRVGRVIDHFELWCYRLRRTSS